MANKLAISTSGGNFTTAGSWVTGNTGTNALLISTSTSTTALTTSNLDSATFTPANQASQYLAIRVGSRASGSPSNTMTVILRNNTTATDIWTFVINVSDIPACTTTDDNGGWLVFKAAASLTPNGTDTYLVRCKLSATTTAVSLCTNGTANNWQRQMFQTATGAPAAGDDMLMGGLWDTTNPAVKTNVSVTMDSTAATDYGSNTNTYRTAALNICKGATLTWGTTASTNYILRLSGHLVVYSGGTYNQGTTGTPIPLTSTAKLQFDCGADNAFGQMNRDGASCSRVWAGYTASWALLTVDAAAAATSLTTNVSTGWKNGDTIALASTVQDRTKGESKTLGADASGTSLPTVGALTNAHSGTSPTQCEVVNLTRGVTVETTTAGNMTFVQYLGSAVGTEKWVRFDGIGSTGTGAGLTLQGTGAVTVQYCAFVNGENRAIQLLTTTDGFTLDNNVFYNALSVAGAGAIYMNNGVMAGSSWSITNNVIIYNTGSADGLWISDSRGTITGNRVAGAGASTQGGIHFSGPITGMTQGTFANNVVHSCAGHGLMIDNPIDNFTCTNLTTWRNGDSGVRFDTCIWADNVSFPGLISFGNSLRGVLFINSTISRVTISGFTIASDTTFTQTAGIQFSTTNVVATSVRRLLLLDGTLGHVTGIYAAHTEDFLISNTGYGCVFNIDAFNVSMESATEVASITAASPDSYIASAKHDRTTGTHKTFTPYGTLAYETTTVDASPSVKLTPTSATVKLDTSGNIPQAGFYVPVDNGSTPTVSIKIQKDASYNGNAPRLILRRNDAVGVTSDTVIGTFSGSSGSFVTVSGTCAAATDVGVYEFVVDCDGTAGNVFVDTFTVTGAGASAVSGLNYWFGGLPC